MIEGWFSVRLNGAERVGFGLGGVLLMIPGLVTDGVGLAVVAVSYLLQRRRLVKGGE
jgi:UPF0716 family protein affecting phage T7 exclusion